MATASKTKIKIFLNEKKKVLKAALAFVNKEGILPKSIGTEVLNDGRFFMTITYTEKSNTKTYQLKEVLVGNVNEFEKVLTEKIEKTIPDAKIICHEMFVDNANAVSFVYLLEK